MLPCCCNKAWFQMFMSGLYGNIIMKKNIQALGKEIKKIGHIEKNKHEYYKYIASAAIVKAYEFLLLSMDSTQNTQPFFSLGTLRAICEDFIVLSFIKKLDESNRNKFVRCRMEIEFQTTLRKQTKFFDKERHTQPVLNVSNKKANKIIKENENIIKEIARKEDLWDVNKIKRSPSVSFMAKELNLKDFYDFYYSLTSELVHFNPRILLRMGWCNDKETMSDFHFSTKNFSGYYQNVSFFYASVLFVRMMNSLQDIFIQTDEFKRNNNEIESNISKDLRWPELITYEEMNIQSPSALSRILYSSVANKSCTQK